LDGAYKKKKMPHDQKLRGVPGGSTKKKKIFNPEKMAREINCLTLEKLLDIRKVYKGNKATCKGIVKGGPKTENPLKGACGEGGRGTRGGGIR